MSVVLSVAARRVSGLFRVPSVKGWVRMSSQVTDRVLMIRPGLFGCNPETVSDNAFQSTQQRDSSAQVHQRALKEFQDYAEALKAEGVEVDVIQDALKLPDAIFPNNWISFHTKPGGSKGPGLEGASDSPSTLIALYPMRSELRRKERQEGVIQALREKLGAEVRDYTSHETRGLYLEGTGSMVLDRENSIAYACLSGRTSLELLTLYCQDFGYELVPFKAFSSLPDGSPSPIYHTNVMMSVGTSFAIVCLDSITDEKERDLVMAKLKATNKEVVAISLEQMSAFAGNVLQLRSQDGRHFLAMSTRAYRSLSPEQLAIFKTHSCSVVHSDLDTIETYGGGGARCMIAEVFPPLHTQP